MSWETNLTIMLRVLINDLNAPQKNTDPYLQQVLVTSAILVESEMDFALAYIYDVSAITIVPDPVTAKDIIFQSLIPLKAACIVNQGQFQTALGQGIKVRDGDSAIDTTVGFRGYRDILTLGPCQVYEQLKWKIQSTQVASIGSAVMTPFRAPNVQSNVSDVSIFFDDVAIFLNRLDRRV